ncbi:MAG: response regulator [Rubrivivax sp.]|nr:MAG: response regulator [Rubrivivax sp.]
MNRPDQTPPNPSPTAAPALGATPATDDGMPLSLRHAVSIMQTATSATAAASERAQSVGEHTRQVTGRPVKVQIVEDLPRVQQLLKSVVEQPGRFEVTGIDDTEQAALQRYSDDPPDVIIVDLNLRQGSGLGVIHAVKRMAGAHAGPLVMVVTNHTMPVLQAACMKAGAHHFLDKSRELPKLRQLLDDTFYA